MGWFVSLVRSSRHPLSAITSTVQPSKANEEAQ